MSEDTTLTPTTLRTLSVPGTPGAGPAAPLKQQIRDARRTAQAPNSLPPATALKQLAAEVPEPTEPLNLYLLHLTQSPQMSTRAWTQLRV